MSNGRALLNEIGKMLEQERITVTQALPIILRALGDLYIVADDIRNQAISNRGAIEENRERNDDGIAQMTQDIASIKEDVKMMKEVIQRNPAILLGRFVKGNPKLAVFIGVMIFVLTNVWLVSGFRLVVLRIIVSWFGLPEEILQFFNP